MLGISTRLVRGTLFWMSALVFSPSSPSNIKRSGWEGAARPIAKTHFTQSWFNENSSTRHVRDDSNHQSLPPFLRNSIFSHENDETTARDISCNRYLQYYNHNTKYILIHQHQEVADRIDPCNDNTSQMELDDHRYVTVEWNTGSNQQESLSRGATATPIRQFLPMQSH